MTTQTKKEIFCKAFSNHICQTLHTELKPCCRFDHSKHFKATDKHLTRPVKYMDKLLTDPNWKEAKYASFETMPGCHRCEQEELVGKKSLRNLFNERQSGDEDKLEFLELSLSNQCNLKCRMCEPSFSSAWSREVSANPILNKFQLYEYDKNLDVLSALQNMNLEHLTRITYLGGEPFITPAINDVFKMLEERADMSKISLEISSNATLFPKKHLNSLSKFKVVTLELSIDGIGPLAEYMRHGKSWKLIDSTIKKWVDYRYGTGNIDLQFSITVQAYNMLHLPEIWKYSNDVGVPIHPHFHFLYYPNQLSAFLLPLNYKKLVEKKIQSSNMADHIKTQIIDMMMKTDHYENMFSKFIDYTNTLDKIRGESIKKVLPELGKYFDD